MGQFDIRYHEIHSQIIVARLLLEKSEIISRYLIEQI